MLAPLVAASIVAVSAMVVYAAVPFGVPSRVSPAGLVSAVATPAADSRGAVRPTSGSVVEGQVLDGYGEALAGAVVDAVHGTSQWRALVLTDAAGRFSLASVPKGQVTLTVRRGESELMQTITVASALVRVTLRSAPQDASLEQRVSLSHHASSMLAAQGSVSAPSGPPSLSEYGVAAIDAYARVDPSGFRRVGDAPLSTFSVDVDSASYSNARRYLVEGELPPADAVRVEEWINYFAYAYPLPTGKDAFAVSASVSACPWNAAHQLLRVTLRGRHVPTDRPAGRNLVYLVDVSGSMQSRDKLPLVRDALRLLVDQMTSRDRIALIVYAGRTELVLPSTAGDQRQQIHAAIDKLEAHGSTNGSGGIQLAYQAARQGFIAGGVNRVVLATDGDFNVGVTSVGELTRMIERERESGVFLSVLAVGRGNLKDSTLEALADRGNGNYAYLDSLQEARRVLVDQANATLVTIAKDVKLQVEFNPRQVAAYRLIGYENRALQNEAFADDGQDAGEIGAGHTVTALYEIVPAGQDAPLPGTTALRYQAPPALAAGDRGGELATVSVRHKRPDGRQSALQAHQVPAGVVAADQDTAFAVAVAEAALVLRSDPLATGASLAAATSRAKAAIGPDAGGWRAEFVRLMELAASLKSKEAPRTSEP